MHCAGAYGFELNGLIDVMGHLIYADFCARGGVGVTLFSKKSVKGGWVGKTHKCIYNKVFDGLPYLWY